VRDEGVGEGGGVRYHSAKEGGPQQLAVAQKWRARATVDDQWSKGGGAMAVSCWADWHGPKMNNDNFDLFKQMQIDLN
jgi:hypothetical protein